DGGGRGGGRGRRAGGEGTRPPRRSPVYALAVRHKVALPLPPESRTLPMVWYIPPLSPVADVVHAAGYDEADPDRVFATIDALRIPIAYLANLFTAGGAGTVPGGLGKVPAGPAGMRATPPRPGPGDRRARPRG